MGTYSKNQSLAILHIAVILFGLTAILGNVIDLSALMIIWWRVLITIGTIYLLLRIVGKRILFSKRQWLIFLGIGCIIALHWLCFYGSVKLANSSVCLICLATTSFFTAIIEPLWFRKPMDKGELLLGLAIIPSMALIAQSLGEDYFWGVVVGLLSAFFASLFAVINKGYVSEHPATEMTLVEMIGVFIFLSVVIIVMQLTGSLGKFVPPTLLDWGYIAILAIVCTNIAWVLSLVALKKLSVFEANLVVNLEPIYGIVMAAVLLKEYQQLNASFYVGASIIIVIVLLYPFYKRRNRTTSIDTQ